MNGQESWSDTQALRAMPIPRKLLRAAFESLPQKTLRKVAEHHDIHGRETPSREVLCKKLSGDDGTYLQSYTSYFTMSELRSIARVFGIEVRGKTKNELDSAIWGFVQSYDRIQRKLRYEDVFANPRSSEFAAMLRDWMEARHSTSNLANLTDGEVVLWQIRYALMDIHGNSFPGVFEAGGDDRPEVFVKALRQIAAHKSAKAFEQIGKVLFNGEVPKTTKARVDALLKAEYEAEAFDVKLEICRKIWDRTGEDIAVLSTRFAAKNPQRFRPERHRRMHGSRRSGQRRPGGAGQ